MEVLRDRYVRSCDYQMQITRRVIKTVRMGLESNKKLKEILPKVGRMS